MKNTSIFCFSVDLLIKLNEGKVSMFFVFPSFLTDASYQKQKEGLAGQEKRKQTLRRRV